MPSFEDIKIQRQFYSEVMKACYPWTTSGTARWKKGTWRFTRDGDKSSFWVEIKFPLMDIVQMRKGFWGWHDFFKIGGEGDAGIEVLIQLLTSIKAQGRKLLEGEYKNVADGELLRRLFDCAGTPPIKMSELQK